MVSIPSHQIKNIIYFDPSYENQKKLNRNKLGDSKVDIIKKAQNEGYFKVVNPKFLNQTFNKKKEINEDDELKLNINNLKFIEFITLHNYSLQKLTTLEYCTNLRYLDLSSNFISEFGVLRHCIHLQCLDLSCNMIEILPESSFWQQLRNLELLYLHDNPIALPYTVSGLKSARSLICLTLWDTPLCLRKRYRHFIVNSIWTLKLLDHHLVSDEEIIEDAQFISVKKFRSMSALMKMMSSYFRLPIEQLELFPQKLVDIRRAINRTLAHSSPVLIIQKWIRGILCRKHLKTQTQSGQLHPVRLRYVTQVPTALSEIDEETARSSTTPAAADANSTAPIQASQPPDASSAVQYLTINLNQLNQTSTIESLDREAQIMETVLPGRMLFTYRSVTKSDHDKCSPEHINRALAKSHSVMSHTMQNIQSIDYLKEPTFRLHGRLPPRCKDPSAEIMIEKNRTHYLIREADRLYHDTMAQDISKGQRVAQKVSKSTNQENFRRKMKGSMAMYLLRQMEGSQYAMELMKRYDERWAKAEAVRRNEENIRQNIEEARAEKINFAKTAEEEHRAFVKQGLERENEMILQNYSEIQDKRDKLRKRRDVLSEEFNFSIGFRAKQNAACNAIDKFEKLAYNQDKVQTSKALVADTKDHLRLEMDQVKNFLDNQAQARRITRRLEKSQMDMNIIQQASSNINEAKKRVEKLKSIRRLVVECPNSVVTFNPRTLLPPLGLPDD